MDGRVKEDGRVPGIERLLLAIEEGRTLGGIRNVEATEILRRSKETDFGAHEGRLTKYAQESGCWFDLKEDIKINFNELVGFAYSHEIDEEGFYFITRQDFIDSKKPRPTQEEIDAYMEKRGFAIHDGTCVFEGYQITDLAPRNFVKDNDGKLYCIDPMISVIRGQKINQ